MNTYQDIINRELEQVFVSLKTQVKNNNVPNILYKAMRYAIFNGGKRIRPVLCVASYKACQPKSNNRHLSMILPFACGIEFIHTFSLIQDDLPCMDDDDFRRGKPSLHRVFGEGVALLAADGLFAKAFELFATAEVDQSRKLDAISALAKTCGATGLVAGQVLDISHKSQKSKVKSQKSMNQKKTGELIACSLKIGAIIAGANKKVINKLNQAGISLGLLFQTTDDIIDKSQKLKIKSQKPEADRYAKQAKMFFSSLGDNFNWFNSFTDYILLRKD